MKTIGLLGGMTCESTVPYYRIINRCVNERLGGQHSAKIWMYSVDFEEIEVLQASGNWDEAGRVLADAAARLETAGADFLVLCTNTMHKVAPAMEARVKIPLLHIADATARAIIQAGFRTIGLLGTRYTMEQDFYRSRLEKTFGLDVLVPPEHDRALVNDVIYKELALGRILEPSRAEYRRVISGLAGRGAQAVILGCTEIGLLVRPEDSPVPLFDTTDIHARAAARLALDEA
jgi:aspartate racemase